MGVNGVYMNIVKYLVILWCASLLRVPVQLLKCVRFVTGKSNRSIKIELILEGNMRELLLFMNR